MINCDQNLKTYIKNWKTVLLFIDSFHTGESNKNLLLAICILFLHNSVPAFSVSLVYSLVICQCTTYLRVTLTIITQENIREKNKAVERRRKAYFLIYFLKKYKNYESECVMRLLKDENVITNAILTL